MRELILYQNEQGQWEAEYTRLPGYRARGATREEAVAAIKRAIQLYAPCRCEGSGEDR